MCEFKTLNTHNDEEFLLFNGGRCIYYPPNHEISKVLVKSFTPLQNNLMQNTFNKNELNAHVYVSICFAK